MRTRLPFLAFFFMLSQDVPFTTLRLYSADRKEGTEGVRSYSEVLSEPMHFLSSYPPPCSYMPTDLCLVAVQTLSTK